MGAVHDFSTRVREPRSSIRLRPTPHPAPTHPSLYDWESDRPSMPRLVTLSLSVLVQHARNPLSATRAQALEAASVVEAWAKGVERDGTPPHGTPRGA